MSRGITITNYLVDGNPEGIVFAYVSNWSGQAIKIPRNSFAEAKNLNELNRPGVYYLIGAEEDKPEEQLVYIGEANNLSERLTAHIRDEKKSFFELIISFSSKDENLSVSHTKYLEAKIIQETTEKSGFTLTNRKEGNKVNLSKMVKDEMDTYFDNMKILLPSMGYDFFKPQLTNIKQNLKNKDENLYLEASTITASSRLTANGIVILKGSLMKDSETDSLSPNYSRIRKDLIEKEIVKNTDKGLEFQREYEFTSPSQAGAVILGYSVNGRTFWKNKNGKTLKQIEEEKINAAANYVDGLTNDS